MVQQSVSGPMHALALWLTVLVVLIIYSRLSERIAIAFGFNPYLVLILAGACFLLMIPTGGLARGLLAKPGILLTLFTVWLLFVTPFSVWRGGSVHLLRDYWSKSYVLYLILAGLLVSVEHCRKVLYALAGAALIVEATLLLERVSGQQRLSLDFGSFANPNDLAFYLNFSLPGCVLLILNSKPFSFLRAVGLVSAGLVGVLVFRTGSRGGFLGILVALFFFFLTSSLAAKIKLIVAIGLIGGIAIATTGSDVIERYRTILGDPQPVSSATSEVAKAQGSTSARKNIMQAAILITLKNPIVGVGPGMFQVAAADDPYTAKVLFAAWKETHNSFTQVSSETGIPGFLLYIAIIFSVFAALVRVWRRSRKRKDLESYFRVAYCLMLMLVMYLVGASFGSSAYNFFLPTLAGLSAALARSFDARVMTLPTAPGAPLPAARPAYGLGL
jgi:O-antigen ligase